MADQAASEAVGKIADAAKDVSDQLDKFFARFPDEDRARFEVAWSTHGEINRDLVKRLERLSRELAPQEVMS